MKTKEINSKALAWKLSDLLQTKQSEYNQELISILMHPRP